MELKKGATVLFQGDSITDSGRNRQCPNLMNPGSFGHGYVNLIVSRLLGEFPENNWMFYNRGIGGNRSVDLYARWKEDGMDLNPDLVSILIGVNDVWHGIGGRNNGVEPERFEKTYRMILDATGARLPAAKIVLCEPFVCTFEDVRELVPGVREMAGIVQSLATEYGTIFAPFQQALDEAERSAPGMYWAFDGVHPSPAGHWVLAQTWLQAVGVL